MPRTSDILGYARVSTADQDLSDQTGPVKRFLGDNILKHTYRAFPGHAVSLSGQILIGCCFTPPLTHKWTRACRVGSVYKSYAFMECFYEIRGINDHGLQAVSGMALGD